VSGLTHADEYRSQTVQACFQAIAPLAGCGWNSYRGALISNDTIRTEHDHTDETGVRRRYVTLVSVTVHAEEIPDGR